MNEEDNSEKIRKKDFGDGVILRCFCQKSVLEDIEKARKELEETTNEFVKNAFLERIEKAKRYRQMTENEKMLSLYPDSNEEPDMYGIIEERAEKELGIDPDKFAEINARLTKEGLICEARSGMWRKRER